MKFLAILDTMWGEQGAAPHWFFINPFNHSGRRLYRLTGSRTHDLLVTNACPQQTAHARLHGTPSTTWLARSLQRIPKRFQGATLLVCGKVAQRTYAALDVPYDGPVRYLKHPAARTWTKQELVKVQRQLTTLL